MKYASDTNVIDIVSIGTDRVSLVIVDTNDWCHEKLLWLQNKVNSYVAYVESGQLVKDHVGSEDRDVFIEVIYSEYPSEEGLVFLKKLSQFLMGEGYRLIWNKDED